MAVAKVAASHAIAREAAATALEASRQQVAAAQTENAVLREARDELLAALQSSAQELSAAQAREAASLRASQSASVELESENRRLATDLSVAQDQLRVVVPAAESSQRLQHEFLGLRNEVEELQRQRLRERSELEGALQAARQHNANQPDTSHDTEGDLSGGSRSSASHGVRDALRELEAEQARAAVLLAEELSLRKDSGGATRRPGVVEGADRTESPSSRQFGQGQGHHRREDRHLRGLRLSDMEVDRDAGAGGSGGASAGGGADDAGADGVDLSDVQAALAHEKARAAQLRALEQAMRQSKNLQSSTNKPSDSRCLLPALATEEPVSSGAAAQHLSDHLDYSGDSTATDHGDAVLSSVESDVRRIQKYIREQQRARANESGVASQSMIATPTVPGRSAPAL